MKNIYKIFITAIMITGLWSCESEDNFMLVEAPTASFAFITPSSGTSIILDELTPANTAVTFTWEDVDYGTPTAVTYTIQFAVNGTEFATPIDVSSAGTTNFSLNVADLNAQAITLGLVPAVEGAVDVRIKATVGTTGSEEKFSDVITLLLTPYNTIVPKREMFLVGAATAAGWSNDNNNVPLFRDPNNDDLYYYTGYFGADQFKVLEVKGLWQPQWGSNDGVSLAVNDGTGSDPGTFNVPAAGYYTFVMNVGDLTFTLEPYTGSTATTFGTVGIIGSGTANGWDASTAMEVSAFDPHIWKVNATLINGEMKFRANDAWAVNWGSDTALSGQGVQEGANIPVIAGNYDIWFNDLDGRYLLIPIL